MVLVDLPLLAAISAVSLPLLLATHIDVMSAPFHLLDFIIVFKLCSLHKKGNVSYGKGNPRFYIRNIRVQLGAYILNIIEFLIEMILHTALY